MRVLLVQTNRERAPQPAMPLGLCLVASALEARGFQPQVLDLCFSRSPAGDLARALDGWRPDAVGLSVRNLDNGEYLRPRPYIPGAAGLARVCRQRTGAPLIIGGPAVSIAPARLLQRLEADYAVVGDGEQALPDLLQRLRAGQPASSVPGVCSRADAAGTPPAPARVEDLEGLPSPNAGRWLALRPYLGRGSPMPIQSKRGCAFECIYCTYRFIEGAAYRLRPTQAVLAEMKAAARLWGARRFEFVDSVFNHPPGHALELCEAIARRGLRADLHTMGLNPAFASRELLSLMVRAGFRSAVCAAESGSGRMLQSLRKGFGPDQVASAAESARAAGIPVLWSFMFGGPGECEDTVRETVRFIERVLGPRDRIICTVGLRVYPGTELELIARQEGAVAKDCDLADPAFYLSPRISPERILELLDGSRRRSQMLYLQALQEPAVSWALRLRTGLHLPGPPWGAVPLYNRLFRRSARRTG